MAIFLYSLNTLQWIVGFGKKLHPYYSELSHTCSPALLYEYLYSANITINYTTVKISKFCHPFKMFNLLFSMVNHCNIFFLNWAFAVIFKHYHFSPYPRIHKHYSVMSSCIYLKPCFTSIKINPCHHYIQRNFSKKTTDSSVHTWSFVWGALWIRDGLMRIWALQYCKRNTYAIAHSAAFNVRVWFSQPLLITKSSVLRFCAISTAFILSIVPVTEMFVPAHWNYSLSNASSHTLELFLPSFLSPRLTFCSQSFKRSFVFKFH